MGHLLGAAAVFVVLAVVCVKSPEPGEPIVHSVAPGVAESCPDCQGQGHSTCPACDGSGINPGLTFDHVMQGDDLLIPVACPRCSATGREACPRCTAASLAGR